MVWVLTHHEVFEPLFYLYTGGGPGAGEPGHIPPDGGFGCYLTYTCLNYRFTCFKLSFYLYTGGGPRVGEPGHESPDGEFGHADLLPGAGRLQMEAEAAAHEKGIALWHFAR